MTSTRFAPLALLALPVALASCTGQPSALPQPAPSTSLPAPVLTAPAPEPAQPQPVPTAPVPVRTSARPVVTTPAAKPAEPARSYAEVVEQPGSRATGRWTLRVTPAPGQTVTGTIEAEPEVRPEILGVADADRDGDNEIFVQVGSGATTATYAVFTLVEDGAAEVRTAGGESLRLVVGGGVRHGDGFRCEGRTLTVLSVASSDGETFEGTAVDYAWRDDRVTETGRTTFTGTSSDAGVRAAYDIACGGLSHHG